MKHYVLYDFTISKYTVPEEMFYFTGESEVYITTDLSLAVNENSKLILCGGSYTVCELKPVKLE